MSETYVFDNLLIGDDYITDAGILAEGQKLTRGTALGKITTGGKLAKLDSTKEDGTETPFAILAADVDATEGDLPCPIYVFGEFNQDAVTFAGSDTYGDFKDGFRAVGVYLKGTIAA